MRPPSSLAAWLAIIGSCANLVHGQGASPTLPQPVSPFFSSLPTTSTVLAPAASSTPYILSDSAPVVSSLKLPSSSSEPYSAIFFQFDPARSADGITFLDTFISISLCSGPSIPSYDLSNVTQLSDVGMSTGQASRATLVRAMYSTDPGNIRPAPGGGTETTLQGGQASFTVEGTQVVQSIWLGIWSPIDSRGVFGGDWNVRVAASNGAYSQVLSPNLGLFWQDTDATHSLLQSYSYNSSLYPPTGLPDVALQVLPSTGPFALDPYFNSSICAVEAAVQRWNTSTNVEANQIRVNMTTSKRGAASALGALLSDDDPTRVILFEASGLQRDSNYTAWMTISNVTQQGAYSQTIWPAVKFRTKRADNCRLVYDVPFCPTVGYSIPVNPTISTSDALAAISSVVTPNFLNFTRTLSTFPCEDPARGRYSSLATCDDCRAAYLDWLCSVTMPRCTDVVDLGDIANGTAASQDGLDLSLATMDTNEALQPYVVNRGSQGNDVQPSRQSFIDQDLRPGNYGELLPCIYGCYFVERACPAPLFKWACPDWGITAQRDYGTFGDADKYGLVPEADGLVPSTTPAWGGPSRFIAQDAFGRTFCNALRVDRLLIRQMSDDSQAEGGGDKRMSNAGASTRGVRGDAGHGIFITLLIAVAASLLLR